MSKYTTISGDTWDVIAKKVYDDDHAYSALMDANPKQIGTLIFSGGIELDVPDITVVNITETTEVATDAAAWREAMS